MMEVEMCVEGGGEGGRQGGHKTPFIVSLRMCLSSHCQSNTETRVCLTKFGIIMFILNENDQRATILCGGHLLAERTVT